MGCCHSSEEGAQANRLPRNHAPNNAGLEVNQAPAGAQQLGAAYAAGGAASRTNIQRPSDAPNQRIRAPSPVPHSPKNVSPVQPPWTRAHLTRQRQIYFETRVAGRTEVWDTLRHASDALVRGRVAEAQTLLDAANLTCPSGRVAKGRGRDRVKGGVYDERGRLYEVPDWVIRDPDDILEEEITVDRTGTIAEGGTTHSEGVLGEKDTDDDAEDDEDDDGALESPGTGAGKRAKQSKGKARVEDLGEQMRVRVRFSNGDSDVEVTLQTRQTVSTLSRLLQERLGPNHRVRLVYLGKVLEGGKTLAEQGWKTGDVLSALVAKVDSE